MKLLLIIPLLLTLLITSGFAQAQAGLDKLAFLEGKWKREGRESYESWSIDQEGNFNGKSFRVKDGAERIVETLKIQEREGVIIYEATVLNQNKGRGIPFILNPEVKDKLSFENLTHDFPNMIQYHKISDQVLLIHVLGKDGKGFSLKMNKVDE